MSMFSICKHTIQESYESGHRKSTDNVTEIDCDNATFTSKWHIGRRKQCKRVARLFHCSRFVVHNDVRQYNWAGNTTDALLPARRKATTPKQDH